MKLYYQLIITSSQLIEYAHTLVILKPGICHDESYLTDCFPILTKHLRKPFPSICTSILFQAMYFQSHYLTSSFNFVTELWLLSKYTG